MREPVTIRYDPRDITEIRVFHHGRFLCKAINPEHIGDTVTLKDIDAARRDVGNLHPLGHMGDVDDIAWGVVYLASDESKFVTGAELAIDGGYTAR